MCDIVLVAAAAVYALIDLSSMLLGSASSAAPAGWLVPVSLGAVAAVALRRRWCLAATVALASVSALTTLVVLALGLWASPSIAALFAFAVLTVRAIHVEPGAVAALVTLVAGFGVLAEAAGVGAGAVLAVAVSLACFSVAVSFGLYLRWVRWRRETIAETARSDERLEIARELHDIVGHHVTGMVVQAQAARHVAADNPAAAAAALERIEAAGAEAMLAMRRMVGSLRDDAATAPLAGWSVVDELVEQAVRGGLPLRWRVGHTVGAAPVELSASIHRILAEALTNVRRHGHDVTIVDAELYVEPPDAAGGSRLVLSVHDDGTVPGIVTGGTYGLTGMTERAASLGGTLYAGPAPNGGWLVRATLPLQPSDRVSAPWSGMRS